MSRIQFSACGAGGGIRPGVERSGTPGIHCDKAYQAREAGGSLLRSVDFLSFLWSEFRFEPFDQLRFVIHPFGMALPVLHSVWSAFEREGVEAGAGFVEFVRECIVLGEEAVLRSTDEQ